MYQMIKQVSIQRNYLIKIWIKKRILKFLLFKKTKVLMIKFWFNEQSNLITGILPFSSDAQWILKIVKPYKGGKFIDCTFGGGGYSKEILNFPGTYIQAIDRDKKVFILAKKLKNFQKGLNFIK